MGKYILTLGISIVLLGTGTLAYTEYTALENNESSLFINRSAITTPSSDTKAPDITLKTKKKDNTVTMYIDFKCPYCRDFYKQSFSVIRKKYQSEISFQIKHFPLSEEGISMSIAEFYECAKEQKNQWEVLDVLYFGYDSLNIAEQDKWIESLSLEKEKIATCLANEKTQERIISEKKEAQENGIKGTPTTSIRGKKFEGNLSVSQLEMEILKSQGSRID